MMTWGWCDWWIKWKYFSGIIFLELPTQGESFLILVYEGSNDITEVRS